MKSRCRATRQTVPDEMEREIPEISSHGTTSPPAYHMRSTCTTPALNRSVATKPRFPQAPSNFHAEKPAPVHISGVCMSDVVFMIALLAVMLGSGCAPRDARKHAEGIAKGWCITIRASQDIPVYPLTADLRVGDVFLVQTPISVQDKQYREKGFLALDDHRCRLAYTNFGTVYFDGYWKDTFGKTPHPTTNTVFAGSAETNGPVTLTVADAPRVAFPTYSFQAQSGYGSSAAFPIEGVPVALSFLGTDLVDGSVTISDARTYAGDESELWQSLLRWASEAKPHLAATARNAVPTPVYLRVVTRVYLARAMDISLIRADAKGGSVRAKVGSDVSLLNSDGTANAAYL